jgi:hypothetical protein
MRALLLIAPLLLGAAQSTGKISPAGDVSASRVTSTGSTTGRALRDRAADVVNVLDFIPSAYHAGIKARTDTHDLTTYIQAAIATGKAVYLPAGTYSVTGLTAVAGGSLIANNDATISLAAGGTVALTIDIANYRVRGVNFEGGNSGPYDTIETVAGTRSGIAIGGSLSVEDVLVEDAYVHGFDNNGVHVTRTAQSTGGDPGRPVVRLRGVTAIENYNGIFLDEYGEYVHVTDCNASRAYAAMRAIGGNNRVVNSHFSRSWRNLLMRNGDNEGHGVFVGCSFNHMRSGANVGIDAYNITFGWTFVGCTFWYSNILLQDSGGFLFVGNEIGQTNITTTYSGVYNGGTNVFADNWLYGTVGKSFDPDTKVVWDRNVTDNLGGVVQLSYSASMAPDASMGEHIAITATDGNAFTIADPTNGTLGKQIIVQIRNNSGGALGAVTWGSAFKMAAWTSPATGYSRSVIFQFWNGTWYEVSRTAADVPN